MKKLLSNYNLKAPIFLVKYLQSKNYSADGFINWYISGPDLNSDEKYKEQKLTPKSKVLAGFCYYFWVAYVLSALAVMTFSPVAGLVALIISPFLLGGVVYAIAFSADKLRKKPKNKNHKKG